MAEEFDHLYCPICDSELVYSEGTHDLGCTNNPKPSEPNKKKDNNSLHEGMASYKSCNKNTEGRSTVNSIMTPAHDSTYKSYKFCNERTHKSDDDQNICELSRNINNTQIKDVDEQNLDYCVFGISFTESAKNGTLWSIRIIDGETNYAALMRLMQNVEKRVKANQPLAANVPNLPKKIERTKVKKLAFRYNLEIEDLYSIKYSTETIERLAMYYNLTNKEIRHIKQSDVMEE